jgi:hypothetical protein
VQLLRADAARYRSCNIGVAALLERSGLTANRAGHEVNTTALDETGEGPQVALAHRFGRNAVGLPPMPACSASPSRSSCGCGPPDAWRCTISR